MRTLKDIKNNLEDIDRIRVKAIRILYTERLSIIKHLWPEFNPNKHLVGDDGWAWDCPDSPFGYCAYDSQDLDDCLFCHEPEERK